MSFDLNTDDLLARKWKYESAGYPPIEARHMAEMDIQHEAQIQLNAYHSTYSDDEIDAIGAFPQEEPHEDALIDADESLSELHAITASCRAHGVGMDDVCYRLATIAYKSAISGTTLHKPTFPTLESVHASMTTPETLMLKFEAGVKETLKNAWEKTKNFFIKIWNKMKMWYVKAWSGCRRLGNRAVAVRKASENKNGPMKNTSFDLSGAPYLHVSGKIPEPGTMVALVKNLASIGDVVFGKTASSYNNVCDILSKATEELAKRASEVAEANKPTNVPQQQGQQQQQQQTTTGASDDFKFTGNNPLLSKILDQIKGVKPIYTSVGLDDWPESEWKDIKAFSSYAGTAENPTKTKLLKSKIEMPGGKMVVVSVYDGSQVAVTTATATIKDISFYFGGMITDYMGKARDVSDTLTAKTLSINQIQDICDSVIESCKIGLDYEKLFVERDKMFNNLGKSLENAINGADKLEGKALAFVKANTNGAVTVWNKINKFDGSYFKYSFGVYSKVIDYCQQSLNNY